MTLYKNKGLLFGGVFDEEGLNKTLLTSEFINNINTNNNNNDDDYFYYYYYCFCRNCCCCLLWDYFPLLYIFLLISILLHFFFHMMFISIIHNEYVSGSRHSIVSTFFNDLHAFDMERK